VDLKGVSKPGVIVLRSAADSAALTAALGSCSSTVVAGPLPFSLAVAQEVSRRCPVTALLGDRALSSFLARTVAALSDAAARRGVKLLRKPVDAIVGVSRAEAVVSGGRVHPCDLVVVLPPRAPRLPATDCARGSHGGAIVDGSMRTSLRGIYAAGECAEVRLGSGSVPTRLRSSSAVMGDVAGTNAAGGLAEASVSRCLAVELFGVEVCAAGIDADRARSLGLDAVEFESDPSAGDLGVSLAFDRVTARLYGVQVAGSGATGLAEFLSLAVSKRCTLDDLVRLEVPHSSPISLTAGRALARARGRKTGEPQGPDLRHG
jgi:NAD(P)H-nitrite reductase large subunit